MNKREAFVFLLAVLATSFYFDSLDIPDDQLHSAVFVLALILRMFSITRIFSLFETGMNLLRRILELWVVVSLMVASVDALERISDFIIDLYSLIPLVAWYCVVLYLSIKSKPLKSPKLQPPKYATLFYLAVAYASIYVFVEYFLSRNFATLAMSHMLSSSNGDFAWIWYGFAVFTLARLNGDFSKKVHYVWIAYGIILLCLYLGAAWKEQKILKYTSQCRIDLKHQSLTN